MLHIITFWVFFFLNISQDTTSCYPLDVPSLQQCRTCWSAASSSWPCSSRSVPSAPASCTAFPTSGSSPRAKRWLLASLESFSKGFGVQGKGSHHDLIPWWDVESVRERSWWFLPCFSWSSLFAKCVQNSAFIPGLPAETRMSANNGLYSVLSCCSPVVWYVKSHK